MKPCPFCSAELVEFGPAKFNHPRNDCWLASVKVERHEFDAWNRRSELAAGAAAGGGTSENTLAPNMGENNHKSAGTRMDSGFHAGAECSDSAAGTEKNAERFGCHCELEPDMEPDGCVIDTNRREDCVFASRHATKEECQYWQPIKVATIAAHNKAGKCAERIVDAAIEKEKR